MKNVHVLEMGRYEMDTWYYSPFPDVYAQHSKLYACEFCLKYMRKPKTYLAHKLRCAARCPPGVEVRFCHVTLPRHPAASAQPPSAGTPAYAVMRPT